MIKATDVVLPPAKTGLEAFERWKNKLQTELMQRPYSYRIKIEVEEIL